MVIIVDANTNAPEPIEHRANAPGLFLMAKKVGSTTIYNYGESMTEVLRYLLVEGPQRLRLMDDRYRASVNQRCLGAAPPDPPAVLSIKSYFVEVSLHKIADPNARRRFLSMPTSLFLSSGDVDALINVGRTLVVQSPEFQRLLADLKAP